MGNQRNLRGLEWLVDEVEANLVKAYESLNNYLQESDDETQLRFCLGYIHQVYGSLKIAESFSGVLLAEEMELLVTAMLENRVSSIPEAAEVLVQAIHKLPAYLHRLIETQTDRPETLLMLLNDIRAVRGEQLASENSLFSPCLDLTVSAAGKFSVAGDDALRDMMKKLRQMYQLSLLGLLKGKDIDKNAGNLEKVFARARELCRGSTREHLWRVAGAVTEGLFHHSIALSIGVRVLLRELDGEFRLLANRGRAAFELPFPEALTKNLLFYVAHSGANTPRISKIREDFRLESALPAGAVTTLDRGLVPCYDQATVKLVSGGILQDLETIKEQIEACFRDDDAEQAGLRLTLPGLKRVADTLAMVGQGRLRESVARIMAAVDSQVATAAGSDKAALQQLAVKLVELEAGIDSWADNQQRTDSEAGDLPANQRLELDKAHQSLLREISNGIEQIKEGIVDYISSKKDPSYLTELPKIISDITGAMAVVGMSRPAEIARSCGRFITTKMLRAEEGPDWPALDALADAITSVEFYLEALAAGSATEERDVLKLAESSVERLGYPVPVTAETAATGSVGEDAESDIATETARQADSELETLPAAVGEASETAEIPEAGQAPALGQQQREVSEPLPEPEASDSPVTDEEELVAAEEEVDPEIRAIFIEEAGEVLEQLQETFASWAEQPDDRENLTVLRRCFHTLKGSGRMVQALDIGELSWAVENLLNRLLDKRISLTAPTLQLVESVMTLLPEMIAAFAEARPCVAAEQAGRLQAAAEALSRGETASFEPPFEQSQDAVAGSAEAATVDLSAEGEPVAATAEMGTESVIEPISGDSTQPSGAEAPDNRSAEEEELLSIFASEAAGHLAEIEAFVAEARATAPEVLPPTPALLRALHTMKGSAQMASLQTVAELVVPLEGFMREMFAVNSPADQAVLEFIELGVRGCREAISNLLAGGAGEFADKDQFLHSLAALRNAVLTERGGGDEDQAGEQAQRHQLLNLLISEEMKPLMAVEAVLQEWQQGSDTYSEAMLELVNALHMLAEIADRSGVAEASTLGRQLAAACENIARLKPEYDPSVSGCLNAGHEALLGIADALAANQKIDALDPSLLEGLAAIARLSADQAVPVRAMDLIRTPGSGDSAGEPEEAQPPVDPAAAVELTAVAKNGEIPLPEELDEEVASIFLEEAEELLEQVDQSIHAWQQDISDSSATALLKRALHTFKGGARMAGLVDLGDASHDFESFAVAAEHRGEAVTADFYAELFRRNDLLLGAVERLRQVLTGEPPAAKQAAAADLQGTPEQPASIAADGPSQLEESAAGLEPADQPVTAATDVGGEPVENSGDSGTATVPQATGWPSARVIPFTGKPLGLNIGAAPLRAAKANGPGKEFGGSTPQAGERRTGPEEMVKISAPVLDNLVNLAGETSISRGQIEQQLSAFIFSLDEMESTIWRLQDQVRRLGVETDAQVMFRREQIESSDAAEDFDPLEMDRYSQLQQLSRALLESASDLQDLKETMLEKSRDAESLLLQQSRINTDLQESLMRTRMVPFSRLVPRLRRIVRQVSGEVGKPVALRLDSVEGEMDRSVLEKMLPPLEHMIRNAIDHGMESPEGREQAGKDAEGTIELGFSREGGDVVIQLADDGRGLDINAIRRRAIDKGLMDAEAILSDREISQFIFEPGFSTAAAVTQVSGRGVGMDVVNSEVRQLGGSIQIYSTPGQGTRFIIRLPFTVSVNRVLMIEVGEDSYALGLNAINGVVRLSQEELENYYQNPEARLEHGGNAYEVRYLGSLLNDQVRPNRDTAIGQVFLILVHAEQRYFAVQVDGLIGTREIVVKTLGNQFSTVPGLSGATIMGDGRVVVILDLPALVRAQKVASALSVRGNVPTREKTVPTVMVVDDSVTVRKVTGRFLEREGFRVITARDGLDAMRVLQDNTPDLMLLDIEMPKMDGFEVARMIRSTKRLQDMPIVMITSRTGSKHRERALSMGVNKYLGKPYQEESLLAAVHELLNVARAVG